jgi:hypothetical protein
MANIIPGHRFRNHQKQSGRIMKENGDAINIADYLYSIVTPLGALITTEKIQQVSYNSNVPLSERRDAITETNSGTVTAEATSEYLLRATSASGSFARLQTKQRGQYVPGNVHEAGLGVRIPLQPTGDAYIKWGYYKDDTGIYCLYDATGFYFVLESDGVELLKVERSNFNQNTLNDLDLSDGNVFQFPFVYYGYGPALLEVGIKSSLDGFNSYSLEIAHSFNYNGSTTISEPNLPLTVESSSGTSGVQLDCYVGGRQISTYGKEAGTRRLVSSYRTLSSIGTTFLPTISFIHKTGFDNISLQFQAIEVISDADLFYTISRAPILTGASYGVAINHDVNEVATEWDVAATAISGGDVVKQGLISGNNKNTLTTKELPHRLLNENAIYTLSLRRISGTNGTATAMFEISEGW